MIETFVNTVILYDDHLTIAYNYSGDNSTVTISDIEKATTDASGFACGRLSRGTRIRTLK